jgi:hypothetical protein
MINGIYGVRRDDANSLAGHLNDFWHGNFYDGR